MLGGGGGGGEGAGCGNGTVGSAMGHPFQTRASHLGADRLWEVAELLSCASLAEETWGLQPPKQKYSQAAWTSPHVLRFLSVVAFAMALEGRPL